MLIKAGRSLIIWTKLDWTPTDTIEIREPNLSRISFQPWYEAHPTDENYLKDETKWAYVTSGNTHTANPLSCTINKDGRYRLMHKQQFVNIDSSITRIHAYILQHYEENWTRNTRGESSIWLGDKMSISRDNQWYRARLNL